MTTTETKKIENGIWVLGKGNFFTSLEFAKKHYSDNKSPNECNPVTDKEIIDGVTYYQVYATNVWD